MLIKYNLKRRGDISSWVYILLKYTHFSWSSSGIPRPLRNTHLHIINKATYNNITLSRICSEENMGVVTITRKIKIFWVNCWECFQENLAVAGVAQWMELWSVSWQVTGSILGQGTHLGCWAGPQLGYVRGNQLILYMCFSLSFSFPSPLSKNKQIKS